MVIFFITGYAFSFGGHALGGAIGAESEYLGAFSADGKFHERKYIFFFACAIISSTIINGALSERARIMPILGFTAVF
jgi:ammonia channel protein AmtB